MNKKAIYAVIAVIVVIILVVAVLEVLPSSAAPTISVTLSPTTASAGQSITFNATISGGTASAVVFNFGDGTTENATHVSGNEYTVTHTFSSSGNYLVTASATVNGKEINNLNSINEVIISPASISPTLASEITAPSIITANQIVNPGSSVNFTGATLQPPTAANWVVGYDIWNFGDGNTLTASTMYNTSSGNYEPSNVSHVYAKAGIYPVSLAVITFNSLVNVYQSAQPYGSFTTNGTQFSQNVTFSSTLYTVTFTETGLPRDTSWTVTLAGTSQSTITNNMTFTEPNGKYEYTITPVSGYNVAPAAGTVTVSGANVNQAIAFTVAPTVSTYMVTFTESGLLKGLIWSVTISNSQFTFSNSTNTSSLTFTVPNGTYDYIVSPVFNGSNVYTAAAGTVTVSGANVNQAITFTVAHTYTVTFTESGLLKGLIWSVTLSNSQFTFSNSTNTSSLTFTVPNGTYSYAVSNASFINTTVNDEYLPSPAMGNIIVTGKSLTQNVIYTQMPVYAVTFTQTGLSSGLTWYVNLSNSQSFSSNTSTITFNEPNGSYVFTISAVNTYVPVATQGNFTYYQTSELQTILSRGSNNYQNTTFVSTIVVNSTAKIATSTAQSSSTSVITNAELVPGGPYSFDPAICYESVGMEVILNVYQTLLAYNGSSTSQSDMIPMVASEIPTVANGEITSNYMNYTFHIRSGLKFSNGDPVNAWDVYASFVRALLFVTGTPGTPDWMIAQDLLPSGGYAPGLYSNGTELYDDITSAITVDNATQTVSFHLLKPDPAFFDYLADPLGCAIMDYSWLVQNGAGISFTPAGFVNYVQYSNEVNYNNYLRYHAMGSGPYMIKSYLIGQFISLAPNPNFVPIPGIPGYNHTATDTINIEWVKDASTEILMLKGGLADIYTGTSDLPNYYYTLISQYQNMGKIKIYQFPTLTIYGFAFNFNVNETMLSNLGTGYKIPPNYFTNLDIRKAFAYAFNYDLYLNDLVGNQKYNANFSASYVGDIPKGMSGYMSPQQLQNAGVNIPYYNLTIAKQYIEESGLANVSINIPVIVTAGDPIDYAAVEEWGATLSSLDKNIVITPMYEEFSQWLGYQVPNENPMPIYMTIWIPDYPFPSDYIMAFYQENGTYPLGAGFNPTILNMSNHHNQSLQTSLMEQDIANAMSTGNVTTALKYYDKAEAIAVNLTNYIYTQQVNWFWYYSPLLKGVQYEENPLIGGGGDTIYIYLSK